MMTVFVAEDQLLIQKDICQKIEKTGKDAQIVGTAINGAEAYEKILALKPDLLITDIRMPIQDGLILIQKLKEEKLPISTVILSGYRDFDYAKEALKLGVNDYLLKPVGIEDLRFVLDNLEEKMAKKEDLTVTDALRDLLSSKVPASPGYVSYFSWPYYYLLSLNLDSFYTFSIRDTLPCREELKELLSGPTVKKYLKRDERSYILDGSNCNEKYILLCLRSLTEEKLLMLSGELIKGIERMTRAVTICVSNPFTDISSLGINRQLMQTQIKNQLTYARSSLLLNRDFLNIPEPSPRLLDDRRLERFQFFLKTRNPKAFFLELQDFLHVCEAEGATQRDLEAALKRIPEGCFPSVSHTRMANLQMEMEEYLSNSRTYDELYASLAFLFEQLYQKTVLNVHSLPRPQELVEEITAYIRGNFSRDININDIAEHFSITPAYLSRIFKKYSDLRPIEYLTSCRISQACRYFRESSLSVREVAELCGYSNQYYFSKAFKSVTSCSPSEYRIRYHQENPVP